MPKGGGKGKPKEAGGEKPDKKAGKEKAASKRSLRKSQSSSVVANENKRRSAAQGQDGEGKGAGKQEPVVEPEWNSESVRAHKLLTDGFTYSMIMGMEDSSDLTSIGYYLYHAIKTGVRKRFIALSGEEIASKVKKFISASKTGNETNQELDFWERMDIWAEAVKHILIQMKSSVTTELTAGTARKELELTGARSKDLIQHMQVPLNLKASDEQSDESGGIREPPPVPPSTSSRLNSGNDAEPNSSKPNKKGGNKDLTGATSTGSITKKLGSEASNSSSNKSRSTNMRKRGEIPLPSLEEINDTPQKGPELYVILQGFYNPKIIQELLKIGVTVDGILLLTDQEVTKRNFSVADIEDSIPGTFRPRNILPDYLKYLEQQSTLPRQERDIVGQFWAGLAEMYNSAPPDSPLLDCALMNFKLPKNEHGLDTSEARGAYASKLFDEAAQRIYEMLVMSDWFHDYTNCSTVKQIKPMEKELEREIYETLLNQVPSECVTVPIIMDCILEQVVSNVDQPPPLPENANKQDRADGDDQAKYAEFNKFGKPDWGDRILQDGLKTLKKHNKKETKAQKVVGPVFTPPLYIKYGDYASIRACHLNETVASHIASTQIAGDLRNVQGLLWGSIPEFNKGLYIKLMANLNHFMYFLPPGAIHMEDMFFVIHLLMSAGVEAQLHKEAELAKSKEEEQRYAKKRFSQMVHHATTELFSSHTGLAEEKTITDTNLSKDHNYLAVNEPTGVHFILAPDSNTEIKIATVGHSKDTPDLENPTLATNNNEPAAQEETSPPPPPPPNSDQVAVQETPASTVEGDPKAEIVAKQPEQQPPPPATSTTHVPPTPKGKGKGAKSNLADKTKAADIAAKKVIETAVELVEAPPPTVPVEEASVEQLVPEDEEEEGEELTEGDVDESVEEEEEEEMSYNFRDEEELPTKTKSNRFIACESEFFKSMKDFSVFKALLECPALLAISDSGALDLSKWVETYLLSAGMSQTGADGVLIGNLSDWNYVEELVPIQTVQLLNNAVMSYLSMQRMYCPFYDTLLFIFNNPIPLSLKSDSQFYMRLKTLPGLQHFLEYTINDNDVLSWLMGIEKVKGAEVIDSLSITTLMKIVPEEQWLLVPSIKYMLYKEQTGQLSLSDARLLKSATDKSETALEGGGATEEKDKGNKGKKQSIDPEKDEAAVPPEGKAAKGRRGSDNKETGDKKKKRPSKDYATDAAAADAKTKPEERINPPSSDIDVDVIPSFHISEAIGQRKSSRSKAKAKEIKPSAPHKTKFDFYDLGKRVIVVASDTYHLFPMDGTTIQYEISTIEPEFRMMQLSISKNGHSTFFYPYYIPHELDISKESYVVCPYFHMVHANGTIFAFQDRRASESAPYIKVLLKQSATESLFSYDKIIFGADTGEAVEEANPPERQETPPTDGKKRSDTHLSFEDEKQATPPRSPPTEDGGDVTEKVDDDVVDPGDDSVDAKKGKKKAAKKDKTNKEQDKEKPTPEQKLKEDKSKKKLKGGDKKGKVKSELKIDIGTENDNEEEEERPESDMPQETTTSPHDAAEWIYSDGDLTDSETGTYQHRKKKRSFYAPNWDKAEILVEPMVHTMKISLPSGLMLEVDDISGPPLTRGVKQSYGARGTASARKESSRYYTSGGTVIRFMQNGTIQILTARGVTTNIREISTNAQRDDENLQEIFKTAEDTKIFNGDIILPTGEFWHIVDGKKVHHDPIYVFTSGPLPNGEIFRRRQDGVVSLHRHDGTTITHYPDGTRFTTRMVIQRDLPEDLEGWVVVGLKYMVEHPNYCNVIFNTLSGNAHIRLPLGDWVRVFADGTMKVTTTDNYSMDVDKNRAVISNPPCGDGNASIPNLTAVKLWHASEFATPTEETAHDSQKTSADTESHLDLESEQTNAKLSLDSDGKRSSLHDTHSGSNKSIKVKPMKMSPDGKKTRGPKPTKPLGSTKSLRSVKKRTSKDDEDKKSITLEGLDGEALEEESYHEEEDNDEEEMEGDDASGEHNMEDTFEQSKDHKKFEILDFLQFTDTTLLCKAVDSWDNRFAVDVYGETIVDRAEESAPRFSTEELINTLSKHCQLPKEFVSGILRTTSSDDLATATRRIAALKKAPIDACATGASTKIFVVKRNLSSYEYLKEGHVEAAVNKARMVRDAMVMIDPLPSRDPRKYITIMQPVAESASPRGTWTNNYREPTFRPTITTNKQLQVANRDDLRWFGYVLTGANAKRPKFIPNARAEFNKKVGAAKGKSVPNSNTDAFINEDNYEEEEEEEEEGMEEETDPHELFLPEGKSDKVNRASSKMAKDKEKGKSGKGDKKEKGEKKEKSHKKSKLEIHKEESTPDHGGKLKKGKASTITKKNAKKANSKTSIPQVSAISEEEMPLPEVKKEPTAPSSPQDKNRLDQTEVGHYPANVKDIKGIYDDDFPVKFQPQFHADVCTEKKAIVVRSFVEIPQINEKMQRALLAASTSYAQTVEGQLEAFEANKFQDPRTEEEIQHATLIKQELIENNLSDMHMLEQRAGRVLRFHF